LKGQAEKERLDPESEEGKKCKYCVRFSIETYPPKSRHANRIAFTIYPRSADEAKLREQDIEELRWKHDEDLSWRSDFFYVRFKNKNKSVYQGESSDKCWHGEEWSATTVQLDMTTDFGKANAKTESITLRLQDAKEVIKVGEFVIPGKVETQRKVKRGKSNASTILAARRIQGRAGGGERAGKGHRLPGVARPGPGLNFGHWILEHAAPGRRGGVIQRHSPGENYWPIIL